MSWFVSMSQYDVKTVVGSKKAWLARIYAPGTLRGPLAFDEVRAPTKKACAEKARARIEEHKAANAVTGPDDFFV